MNTLTLQHIEYVCGINYSKLNEFIGFHDFLFYHYIIGCHLCNQTEQVNQSSVSRTETEQNRTCKKAHKNLDLNCRSNNKQTILS